MINRCRLVFGLCVAFGLVFFTGVCAVCADWPQWRGPGRDGLWHGSGLLEKFGKSQSELRWRVPISNGFTGPTVAANRVYVMDRVTEPRQQERVLCFDATSGARIWVYAYDCKYEKVSYPNGPRASVTIEDGRAYSLGTMGHLLCLDAADGKVLWKKTPGEDYEVKMPEWGITSAPLIEDDLAIIQIGAKDNGCVIAFDNVTGKERWRALEDTASYSAPIIIDQSGKRVMVVLTAERVVGLDIADGTLYWEHPFKSNISVSIPVFGSNCLFVSSFFDGALVLKVSQDKLAVEKLWRRKGESERKTDGLHCMNSTPMIIGDYIYGVDSYGELRCLDLKTGDRMWESQDAVPKARWANIHMVRNGDNIWMFNERGELLISKLSPKGFEEISRAELIEPTTGQLDQRGGVCWSHLAYANRHVYIRNDHELVCADLSKRK